ncbi:MAG: cytochrome b [Pseudomonadota bacterium]
MKLHNTAETYGVVTKLLHWVMAGLMIGLIWLGWYMVDLTYYDRWYNKSLEFHKSFGLVVFAVGLILIIWKQLSPAPELPQKLPKWQKIAAKAVHFLLLLFVLLLPVTGFLISTSAGKSVSFFTWFDLPPVIEVDEGLRDIAISTHFYLAYGVLMLVLLHAGAAIKHQFIDRDGTLARMIWR